MKKQKWFKVSFEVVSSKENTIRDEKTVLAECYEDAISKVEDEVGLPFVHIMKVEELEEEDNGT